MTKLKLKFGAVEIDYEGPEEFLKQELSGFIKTLAEIAPPALSMNPGNGSGGGNGSLGGGKTLSLGITTIAAKLNVNSGPTLALASAAYLTFVVGKETFSRGDILDEMKKATGYYNTNHTKNLSNILSTLLKDQDLVQGAGGDYSLGAAKRANIQSALAQ